MKLNKSKNKGKVHPSPCCSSNDNDPISSLNHLLPTAILTLISILSLQDREALAYMITHSLKSSNNLNYPKKKSNKRNYNYIPSNTSSHTSPSFDCCCFDCFSHFWNRWDSSPHSELIHQAIEAFEEHLSSTEIKKKKNNKSSHNSSKRRENNKMGCSSAVADVEERDSLSGSPLVPVQEVVGDDVVEVSVVLDDVEERENDKEEVESPVAGDDEEEERESGTQKKMLQQQHHKGLARKVLPDFIGLFHSRLWNLWGPNV